MQFCVGDLAFGIGDGAVIDDRHLIAAPVFNVAVDRVIAGIDLCVCEPAIERGLAVVERPGRRRYPVDCLGLIHPETFRIVFPRAINVSISHVVLPNVLRGLLCPVRSQGKRCGSGRCRTCKKLDYP